MLKAILSPGLRAMTSRLIGRHTSFDRANYRAPTPAVATVAALNAREHQGAAPTPRTTPRLLSTRPSPGTAFFEFTPQEHAERLLSWLVRERGIQHGLLFDELVLLYHEMTDSIGWRPRPWNPVGRELRKRLGGKKSYARITADDGVEHRLRIYYLPAPRDSVVVSSPGAQQQKPT